MKENEPNWNKQLCCQSPQFLAVSSWEWPVHSSKKRDRVNSCVPSKVVWLCICDEVTQNQSNCSWMTLIPWLCEWLRMSVPSSQGCCLVIICSCSKLSALCFRYLSPPHPPYMSNTVTYFTIDITKCHKESRSSCIAKALLFSPGEYKHKSQNKPLYSP